MATKKKSTEDKDTQTAIDGTAAQGEVSPDTKPEVSAKPKGPTKAELAAEEAEKFKAEHGKENENIDAVFYTEGPWPLLSRAAAMILGSSRYYQKDPCQNGHDAPRKTKSCACLVCARLRLRERHKNRLQNDADYKAKVSEKAKARRLRRKEEFDNLKKAAAGESTQA